MTGPPRVPRGSQPSRTLDLDFKGGPHEAWSGGAPARPHGNAQENELMQSASLLLGSDPRGKVTA